MANKEVRPESENQASALIDLVLLGEDADELMGNTIEQIKEGSGPYPVGSSVKVNQAYSAEKGGGGTVALKQGDKVSIINPHLGEKGTDKMVLMDDGTTKVIVPLSVLGEEQDEVEEEETNEPEAQDGETQTEMETGPDGHEVPSKGGKPFTWPVKVQGSAAPKSPKEKKGAATASSVSSTVVGQSAPKSDPSTEKKGSSAPAGQVAGKKLEDIKSEIIQGVDLIMDGEEDLGNYKKLNTFKGRVESLDDEDVLEQIHTMMFSEGDHDVDQLVATVEACDSKKKGRMAPVFPLKGKKKEDTDDEGGQEEGKVPPQFLSKMKKKKGKEKEPDPKVQEELRNFDFIGNLLEKSE